MMKRISVVYALLILSIIGQVRADAQSSLLVGRVWKLESINGKTVNAEGATLEFDLAQARFNGNGGCNRMSGNVKVRQSSIKFGSVAMTRRACVSTESMQVENRYSANLGRVRSYRVDGDKLTLYTGKTSLLTFSAEEEAKPVADQIGLDEKKWMLDSIRTDKIGKVEQQPFIVFDSAKGTVGGNTGCNVFSGSYTAKGSQVTITKEIATMRACVEDLTNLEQRFSDTLAEVDRFDVKGNTLLLYKGNVPLLMFIGIRKD
jgi:heat shock protein HslJ